MTTATILNIGVIGCANIALRSVIPAILDLKDHFRLAGIASRSEEKARSAAAMFQCRAFGDYQTLLDMPELHAVYIPLPNALHAEWIDKALERGLHVLVEKSLACAYGDVVSLNERAREKDIVLIENFQFRFHRQLAYIRELLGTGAIGELRSLRSSFGIPGLPDEHDIRYQHSLGGGALLDTGAYPLKIAQFFLGREIDVKSATLNYIPGKEVDMWGGAYVSQRHGDLFGELAFGFDNHYQCSIELWGSKGKIFTNRIFTAGDNHIPLIDLETASGRETIALPADRHFTNMLAHFYEAIHHRGDPAEEYVQNINQARLIHEIKLKALE